MYCDGAAKGNPGRGGWGALVATPARVVELGGREDHTTNNRMELTAAIEALTCAKTFLVTENLSEHKNTTTVLARTKSKIVVHTDSSYVINGITKWVRGWEAKGWITAAKQPVLNKDLWVALVAARDACATRGAEIAWQYVAGHVGIAGNERVDTIASDLAEGKPVELFDGARDAYTVDITNLSAGNPTSPQRSRGSAGQEAKTKSASKLRSKAKAYSYISKVDGKIETHKTWGECEARVKGKMARFKKATSPEEEHAIIAEFSR